MKKPSKRIVIVSDFDGTISKVDFFCYVVDNLLTKSDLQPWQDFLDKKITHIESLAGIFGRIRLPRQEFDAFIRKLPLEEHFLETVNFCRQNDISFNILSAGADYYIKLILEDLNISDFVGLYTNKSSYNRDKGIIIPPPNPDGPFYSHKYGIDKVAVIECLKKDHDLCIFAGDGSFDFKAAQLADIVFARQKLLDLCREHNINALELNSFEDILKYLKDL